MTAEATDSNLALPQRAEARLSSGAAATQPVQSLAEANLLLHELRVHQIELEIQTEELRRAQVELAASRARYFDLYDLAPVGYLTVGEPGLILEANLTISSLLGVPRGALVKQLFSRLLLKEDQDLYCRHRQQLLATGEPQTCELRLVKADGTAVWAQLAATVAQDAAGRPLCYIVLSDICERKRLERVLEASEKRFREVLENSLDASYKRNLQTNAYDYLSPVFVRITGYTPEEMRTLPIESVMACMHPEDLPEIERILADSMSSASVTGYQLEYRFKHKQGHYCWVQDRFTVVRDTGGQPLARIGSVRDITEHKRSAETLRASEERFRTLVATAPITVAEVDKDGVIQFINRCSEGFEVSAVTGTSSYEYMDEEGRRVFRAALERVFASGKTDRFVLKGFGDNRTLCWWETVLGPVVIDGAVASVVQVSTDITDRKRMEDALRDNNAELERRVTARTRDLLEANAALGEQQEQLVQAAKMAALGTLVASVAHEINNPNQFIMLNTPILRKLIRKAQPLLDREYAEKGDFPVAGMMYSELRERIPNLLDGISTGAERIRSTVAELRNFSVRTAEESRRELDVVAVVNAAIALLAHTIKKATANFTVISDPDIPAVVGVPQRLEQVILNLLQNACQALPDVSRGICVEIRGAPNAAHVTIQVRDEGVGMSAATLSRLGEPFFSTRQAEGGTGLGLSIAHRIVREHGGQLTFTSEPDKGTVAQIVLPVSERRVA